MSGLRYGGGNQSVKFVVLKSDGSQWTEFDMSGTYKEIMERFDDWRKQPGCGDISVTVDGRPVLEYHASERV